MNNIFKKTIIAVLLLTVVSCSNDFLNENLNPPVISIGESTIYISPEWEEEDYQFSLPGIENVDFKIEAVPSWLHINSKTGKLINSIATIRCSATKQSNFEAIGTYIDKMKISAGEQIFYVPVSYITEGKPEIQVKKTQTFDYYYPSLEIQNSGAGVLIVDIVSLPDWLSIDIDRINAMNPTKVIISQYSLTQLPFIFNPDIIFEEKLTGIIVLKTNDKNNSILEVEVDVNLGNPEINIWLNNNTMNFGATSTTYSLDIDAWGSGLLAWHFEEVPDWLTITPSKGIYRTHTYYEDVIFTCDRTKLQPGVNSSVIYLKSNAYNNPSIAITVTARAPGNNANIRALEGNITDAVFDKNTNMLYYVTSQPDKFIAYDVTNRSVLRELKLKKAPTCLAVSEDCTKAAIGYGGQISAVNLKNWSIKNIDINGTLFDIAWSEGDWFSYTIDGYNSDRNLYWVNSNDLTNYGIFDNHIYSRSIIKKVPKQSYLVASRQYLSPSGFIVFSTSSKNIKSYSHMDLTNFWFSQDGQYTFCQDGNIYRTSTATDSNDTFNADINSIGRFKGDSSEYLYIKCMDHSSASQSIWLINSYSGDSNIYQYDDNNFDFQKRYFYSDIYQPNAQSDTYEVEAEYVFSNKKGTELSVLCKGINNNNWSIEFIQITQ